MFNHCHEKFVSFNLNIAEKVAQDLETVLQRKYPAKCHAERVSELLKENHLHVQGFIYLEEQHSRPEESLETYDCDEVRFFTDLSEVLAQLVGLRKSTVYTLPEQLPSNPSPKVNAVNSVALKLNISLSPHRMIFVGQS